MFESNIIKINDDEFFELIDIIYKFSGLTFKSSKKYLIEYKLSGILNEKNFTSFKDYIYLLKYPTFNKAEIKQLINSVSINETYFFREKSQIDHVVNNIIPALVKNGKKKFRIWSAACSSGEEVYSILMSLNEAGLLNRYNFEILGTDINSNTIAKAIKGEYKKNSFRGEQNSFISKYFTEKNSLYYIRDDIKKLATFHNINLFEPRIKHMIGKVDILFCRNILIYFDLEGKKKITGIFFDILDDNGILLLGHAETLSRVSECYLLSNFKGGSLYTKVRNKMG